MRKQFLVCFLIEILKRLAAELLMPESMLLDDLKGKKLDIEDDDLIRELADRYRVSTQALTYRLVNLGHLKP